MHVQARMRDLMADPFILRICEPASCQPLANIYVCADTENKTTAVAMPCLPFPEGYVRVKAFQ